MTVEQQNQPLDASVLQITPFTANARNRRDAQRLLHSSEDFTCARTGRTHSSVRAHACASRRLYGDPREPPNTRRNSQREMRRTPKAFGTCGDGTCLSAPYLDSRSRGSRAAAVHQVSSRRSLRRRRRCCPGGTPAGAEKSLKAPSCLDQGLGTCYVITESVRGARTRASPMEGVKCELVFCTAKWL